MGHILKEEKINISPNFSNLLDHAAKIFRTNKILYVKNKDSYYQIKVISDYKLKFEIMIIDKESFNNTENPDINLFNSKSSIS